MRNLSHFALEAAQRITGFRVYPWNVENYRHWRSIEGPLEDSLRYWAWRLKENRRRFFLRGNLDELAEQLRERDSDLFARVVIFGPQDDQCDWCRDSEQFVRFASSVLGRDRLLSLVETREAWPELEEPNSGYFNQFFHWFLEHSDVLLGAQTATDLLRLWKKGIPNGAPNLRAELAVRTAAAAPSKSLQVLREALSDEALKQPPLVYEALAKSHFGECGRELIRLLVAGGGTDEAREVARAAILRGLGDRGANGLEELRGIVVERGFTPRTETTMAALARTAARLGLAIDPECAAESTYWGSSCKGDHGCAHGPRNMQRMERDDRLQLKRAMQNCIAQIRRGFDTQARKDLVFEHPLVTEAPDDTRHRGCVELRRYGDEALRQPPQRPRPERREQGRRPKDGEHVGEVDAEYQADHRDTDADRRQE